MNKILFIGGRKDGYCLLENLVESGELDPDLIHVAGIYVKRVVKIERPSYYPSID